jgi:hypothetical protein
MILPWIDVGHPNDIGIELAEEHDVAHAVQICQRIHLRIIQGVRWRLICDASDEEFGAIRTVEEM